MKTLRLLLIALALFVSASAFAKIEYNPDDLDCVIDFNWWGGLAPEMDTIQILAEHQDGDYEEMIVSVICTATDDLKMKDGDGVEFEVNFLDCVEYITTFYRTKGKGMESCGGWDEGEEYVAKPCPSSN